MQGNITWDKLLGLVQLSVATDEFKQMYLHVVHVQL